MEERQEQQQLEISGRSVDEAIEVALRELDAEHGEVTIEVLNQGRTGIFGIGSEQARVRITRLSESNPLAVEAIGVVSRLLVKMDVAANARLQSPGDDEIGPTVDIQGDDSGLLIGKRGETLQALQLLVNLMLAKNERHPLVVLDVEGYKERRARALGTLASRVADRVTASGTSVTLEPMPASERRIVHMALSEHRGVFTESVGNGSMRRVTVIPNGGSVG